MKAHPAGIAVLQEMCAHYSGSVNASDAAAYSSLFAKDAIWMPPGAPSREGPGQIEAAEGADYEREALAVTFTPVALLIGENWIYGIAHVKGSATERGSGKSRAFKFTVTWLLEREPDGSWKIKRQMWNHRP